MTVFGQPSKVIRVPLDWRIEPERAALLVRRDPRPFALIGAWAGAKHLPAHVLRYLLAAILVISGLRLALA